MPETIQTAEDLVMLYMDCDIPVMITGHPGVGKSDLWRQVAKKRGIGFIDVRMGSKELVDLMGLPTVDEHKDGSKFTNWARPGFLPVVERDGPRGIFLVDEISDCNKPMQSCLYQLFLNRQINDHPLPEGWYPCSAGNSRSSKAAAQTMSTALANRFAHIDVEPCQKAFDKWANVNDIHPYVRAYLKAFPQMLHQMPKEGDLRAFPSPRAWAQCSKICEAVVGGGGGNQKANEGMLMRGLRGLVGEGAASEFIAKFFRLLKMPEFEDILKDPKKAFIPDEPSSKYAVSNMLAANADSKNIDKIMTYVRRKEFGVELEVCVILDATTRDPELLDTKAYSEFSLRNQDIHI